MIHEDELTRFFPKTSILSLISIEDAIIHIEPVLSKHTVFKGVLIIQMSGGGE